MKENLLNTLNKINNKYASIDKATLDKMLPTGYGANLIFQSPERLNRRAGITEALNEAVGDKPTFIIRNPVTSKALASLAGGSIGGLSGYGMARLLGANKLNSSFAAGLGVGLGAVFSTLITKLLTKKKQEKAKEKFLTKLDNNAVNLDNIKIDDSWKTPYGSVQASNKEIAKEVLKHLNNSDVKYTSVLDDIAWGDPGAKEFTHRLLQFSGNSNRIPSETVNNIRIADRGIAEPIRAKQRLKKVKEFLENYG